MNDLLPDLCDVYPDDVQWLPLQWHSYGGKKVFYGEVVTVRCYHDNSYVRRWVNQPGEGKVLFVEGSGSLQKALLGDQLALKAQLNGWAGIVVHGAIRDVDAISKMSLGVMALGSCPIKTNKRELGEEQVALRVAGCIIAPKYHLYADLNGVVISRHALNLALLD